MKKYQKILTAILILVVFVFTIIVSVLGYKDTKAGDPLPILSSKDLTTLAATNNSDQSVDSDSSVMINTIYIQASSSLQIPLDAVIIRFEARNPEVEVQVRYVSDKDIFMLSETINTDLIIADSTLSEERLSQLEDTINMPVNSVAIGAQTDNTNDETVRLLASFSYAIKDSQRYDGVILTDNSLAASFRNFLISSSGQDILRQYDFENIEGYQNSVDDLFNPKSTSRTTVEQVELVTESLENGN